VTHAYDPDGSYSVTLTVTDDDGETYEVSLSILVLLHDLSVLEVIVDPTEVVAGTPVTINATVLNNGTVSATFNVTVYYDDMPIDTATHRNLVPGENATLSFTWNTDVAAGEYIIKAYAFIVDSTTLEPRPDLETNLEDNTLIDGTVTVTVPAENHDVAVLSVVPSPTTVIAGDDVNIDVEVENQGDFEETFTVEIYANGELLDQTDVTLLPGGTTMVSFTWTTTTAGDFTVSAEIPAVAGEVDVADNAFTDGTVTVEPPAVEVHDVAITDVTASPSTVAPGDAVSIDVALENQGTEAETFDVIVMYDSTVIETRSVTLAAGATTTESFTWDTTGVTDGTYTISAEVPAVAGETDTADNTFTDGTVTIETAPVDTTPPTITITEPTARDYLHSEDLTLSFTAEDLESGVASVVATLDGEPVADGEVIPLYTLSLSEHTFEVTAVDNAGNSATETVTFNVIATVESLQDLVEFFFETGDIAPPHSKRRYGILNSLLAKLRAAEAYINDGDIDDAIGALGAFINQLEALSGKKHVSEFAANILIADAQYVIDHL
jgi:predicted thioesterase